MAQYDWLDIDPDTENGTQLADRLDAWVAAVQSYHRGSAEPTYVETAMEWQKTVSGTVEERYVYDGAQSLLLYTINPTAHTIIFPAASIPTATTSAKGASELATTTEVLTGTDATRTASPDAIAALWEKGTDNNGTSTITLGEGGTFNVGVNTTTITAFAFTTDKAGRRARLKFTTARQITHNATSLILPAGGANIAVVVGDSCEIESLGSGNFRVLQYTKADGTALVATSSFVPRAYISPDFFFSNNTGTPNTQIDYSAGQVTDGANAVLMAAASGTINLAGTGANGLDTGSLAANTGYWLYIISNGTLVRGLASLSASSPTMPGGYTIKRIAGLFMTDASAHVIPWVFASGVYSLSDPTTLGLSYGATLNNNVLTTLTLRLPTGKKIMAHIRATVGATTNNKGTFSVYDPDQAAQVPSDSASPLGDAASSTDFGTGITNLLGLQKRVSTNTSAQLKIIQKNNAAANSSAALQLIGWETPLS